MRRTTAQRIKYVVSDWITTNIAFFLFNCTRWSILREQIAGSMHDYLLSETLVIEQILIPFGLLISYFYSGYYNSPLNKSRLQEAFTTMVSAAVNTLLIYLLLLTNDQVKIRTTNYELLGVLFLFLFLITYVGRLLITLLAIHNFHKHKWTFRTMIVGTDEKARALAAGFATSKAKLGISVVGFVRLESEEETGNINGTPVITLDQLVTHRCNLRFDQVIISPSIRNEEKLLRIIDRLLSCNLSVKIAPDTLSFVTSSIRLRDIFGEPFVDITAPSISDAGLNVKRTSDILLSIFALTVMALPMLIIAAAIKLTSPGPAIYSQKRTGYHRRPFNIYKFRSMRIDAEGDGRPRLSSDNDQRITPLGTVLRKYRLDELPQFWNVLKGDMSLVGPRPERPYFVRQIVARAPYYALIHQVRPGITSWGMVKYGYARTVDEMVERVRFDLIYLANMSVTVDAKILIYTIKTVLTGKGM